MGITGTDGKNIAGQNNRINNGSQITNVNNNAQQFASPTKTLPGAQAAKDALAWGTQTQVPQWNYQNNLENTVRTGNLTQSDVGNLTGTNNQNQPNIERTTRNSGILDLGGSDPEIIRPPVDDTISDAKKATQNQPNPSFVQPVTINSSSGSASVQQGVNKRSDFGTNRFGIANDLNNITGLEGGFKPGKKDNQNQLGISKKKYSGLQDPNLQADLASVNKSLQDKGYPGIATVSADGRHIVIKVNPNVKPVTAGPDKTPEQQQQQGQINQSIGASNAVNSFIEMAMNPDDPNSLINTISNYQQGKGVVGNAVNDALKQAIPDYEDGDPEAEAEVQRVLSGMADRAARSINDRYLDDTSKTMQSLRKSGFANSTLAGQVMASGAEANRRRAINDTEDALFAKETETRNAINDRKTNQIRTLMGYGGPQLPSDLPKISYADPSLTSRPMSEYEKTNTAINLGTGLAWAKNNAYANFFNNIMQNTGVMPGTPGIDPAQIAQYVAMFA